MAHSYVQAHDDEAAAFECFVRAQPQDAVLLIDTYDTERAAGKVVALARKLAPEGLSIKGVRIDSGDLGEHARRMRAILDAAALREITILASGNLDEQRVLELVAQGAPIDGFGVGTRMNTSSDAPFLDCAYKLQEYEGRARRKRSEGKATWPGCKQVFRRVGADGRFAGDIVTLSDETVDGYPTAREACASARHRGSVESVGNDFPDGNGAARDGLDQRQCVSTRSSRSGCAFTSRWTRRAFAFLMICSMSTS